MGQLSEEPTLTRQPRRDAPGAWHHVMNRGVARRTMFENRADIRFFLARLAAEVRRKTIEIHAFCILTTHFHFLVRSPDGQLSDAMRRVQNSYVRRFNRTRRRDGPLVRGRFLSRPVDSLAYRLILVRYIDNNATQAGLAAVPSEYPYCSASYYRRNAMPRWLERSWIEAVVCKALNLPAYEGSEYTRVFGGSDPQRDALLVQSRLQGPPVEDPLDDLLSAAPQSVLRWMERKARLADDTSPGLPVADPASVMAVVARLRQTDPAWEVRLNHHLRDAWLVMSAGLLRDLSSVSFLEMASHLRRSGPSVARYYRCHSRLMLDDPIYARRAGTVAEAVLAELGGGLIATVGNRSAAARE
jgi:REP element-mobilizing transposase RayT